VSLWAKELKGWSVGWAESFAPKNGQNRIYLILTILQISSLRGSLTSGSVFNQKFFYFWNQMNPDSSHKTLIIIAGPTAVGKTAVAIKVASIFHAEIISADSRQFFRELNIGTAKPSEKELSAVPHYFVNSHSIVENYDAAQFGEDALKKIHELFKHSSHAILCGGSGLYIRAVVDGFDEIPEIDAEIRERLTREYESQGLSWLQDQMQKADPEYFAQLDQQNPQRLMRALEVKLGTGTSIGTFRKNRRKIHDFNIVRVGLELPREELYQRIDYRMDEMIRAGLFDEAKLLYPYRKHNALQTVGYQEIFDFIEGQYDREKAIRLLKRNSRRYAKRQLTWFKRDQEMKWFHPAEIDNIAAWIRQKEKQTSTDS
jgi:tRNA dimethylallyltransferase